MTLKLNGSTAGSVSIDAPADTSPTGTDVTLTLPTSAGSSGQYLQTNGSGALSWQTVTDTTTNLTRFTVESLSSGTASVTFDLSSVSNIRKIYVLIDNVAKSTNSTLQIQLGDSGGIETSGYSNGAAFINTASVADCDNGTTTGFAVRYGGTDNDTCLYTIANVTGNDWIGGGTNMAGTGASAHYSAGRKQLSGACTQLRVLSTSGNMNSGNINVMVEN
jgi:hypothetical protein